MKSCMVIGESTELCQSKDKIFLPVKIQMVRFFSKSLLLHPFSLLDGVSILDIKTESSGGSQETSNV